MATALVHFKCGENGGKAFCGTVCLLVLENAQEYEIAKKLTAAGRDTACSRIVLARILVYEHMSCVGYMYRGGSQQLSVTAALLMLELRVGTFKDFMSSVPS